MLREQPKEKDRRRVAVPDDLREALREAFFLINESERDPDVRVDYDDAIQLGCLIGGRVGSDKRPFEFTYYRDGDHAGAARWHLALHPIEIEDIVDGHMTEITLYCCRTPDCGCISNDPEYFCSCDYVNDPYSGSIDLSDTVEALNRVGISGLCESSTHDDVLGVLGEPHQSGGGEKNPVFGYIWPWIKYNRTECQVRFEFHTSGKLRGVSILDPDWKPGI